MDRLCKNCAKFYNRKEKVCPYCGTPAKSTFKDIKNSAKIKDNKAEKENIKPESVVATKDNNFGADAVVGISQNDQVAQSELKNENNPSGDKAEQVFDFASKDIPSLSEEERDKIVYVPHRKRKQNVEEEIKVEGIHIDVSSSSMFEKKLPKKNVYQNKGEYSAKKSRGDYALEKLQWWEIYRWADRVLARRKIKKIVNKESTQKPDNISVSTLLVLCLVSGFLGMHNIYAKNYGKGFFMLGSFLVSLVVIMLAESVPFFASIQLSIGGLSGMIVMVMWLWDLFAIIFKKFRYRTTKLAYIKSLDVETRARLGTKYI